MSLSITATSANLTRYLAETPASVEKSLKRQETLYSVAMKISALAAVAFFAIPFLITAGVISIAWIGVPTAVGCAVAAIICTKGHVTFEKRMQEVQFQKSYYAGVSDKVSKKIKSGETKEIEAFFKKNKGAIAQIPQTTVTALAKVNSAAPLDALKPLIIRYEESDLFSYGLQDTLMSVGTAIALLGKPADTEENLERLKQRSIKQATMLRLSPHYAKQRKECAELLGLKA